MGTLDQVVEALRQAGLRADYAYPGRRAPHITQPAAAVHLSKADREGLTVEVHVLCPTAMGGTACESEGLKAVQVLRQLGGVCVQSGCRFDGVSQVYVVPILAAFPETREEDWALFTVSINDVLQPYALAVAGEESADTQVEYVMGELAPVGASDGKKLWSIRLEEKIPPGMPETAEPQGEFTMKVKTAQKTEVYGRCHWDRIRRELTGEGLQRIRTGIALERKEERNE